MAETVSKLTQKIDLKYGKTLMAPLLITAILVGAHISFGILGSYPKLAAAIGTSIAAELLLGKFMYGQFKPPIVWPFALCSLLSITSKYVLRFKGQHIWNPSNFGIVALVLIAADSTAVLSIQWGNNMLAMTIIWIVGFFSLYKINRSHICATYVLGFLAFGAVRAWLTGDAYASAVAPLTGPMYQLFVLFMITDPKTTVSSRWGQYAVAFMIAFVEMIFRLNDALYAPFYALFVVGPIAMMIELWWKERNQKIEKTDSAEITDTDKQPARVQ